MGLFGKSKSEKYMERLAATPTTLTLNIHIIAARHGYSRQTIMDTKFVAAYISSFPEVLGNQSEQLESRMRLMLFAAIYGEERGREIYRKAAGHALLEDEQVRRGADAGEMDGQRYFTALQSDANTSDCFSFFETACEIRLLDQSQTI